MFLPLYSSTSEAHMHACILQCSHTHSHTCSHTHTPPARISSDLEWLTHWIVQNEKTALRTATLQAHLSNSCFLVFHFAWEVKACPTEQKEGGFAKTVLKDQCSSSLSSECMKQGREGSGRKSSAL